MVAFLGRTATKLGTKIAGSTAGRAGAAGAGAGLLGGTAVDDIPVFGPVLDPTESGQKVAGVNINMVIIAVVLLVVYMEVYSD